MKLLNSRNRMFRCSQKIYLINKSINAYILCYKNAANSVTHLPLRYFFITVHTTSLCTTVSLQGAQGALNFKNRNNDFGDFQRGSVKMLEELLNLRPTVVKDIVLKCKRFQKVTKDIINENYDCCLENGVSKKTMQKFPEILAELDIIYKIPELKRLQYDINITTPLLSLTYNSLKAFVVEEMEVNRIAVISDLLMMKKPDVCKTFTRRSFLISLNLDQISKNIELLTDNGITNNEIINDLWVLRYSTETIQEKLDMAKKNNIDTFKTWMVRAQPEIFYTYIKRRSDNKLILGDSSLTQYLSERLQCTEEIAKYIISKQPALQNKSLKKMNEMIDYLFKCGFKPIHICRVPKILLHSVDTTRKRLKELEAKGMHLDSLYILTKSQRQYMQYYESLIKTGKNKLKNT